MIRSPFSREEEVYMRKGIFRIAVASCIFGAMPSANKYVMLSGISAEAVAFWGQLTICAFSYLLIRLCHKSVHIKVQNILCLIVVGALGMGATTFLVNKACLCIPVGLATVLHFLYPTIVSLAMILFFGQKAGKLTYAAIVCSIAGMILIAGLRDNSGNSKLIGVIFALASSLTYSFYILANDKGRFNDYPPIVKLFYASIGSSLLMGTLCLATGGLARPTSPEVSLILFVICGMGCMVAFYLIISGIKLIGAETAAFFNMLEPIASVIISALIYKDHITFRVMCGMTLVILSVLFAAIGERRAAGTSKQ